VELRALCNEVPRTPPGPEGSNGTGIASGAADHPEFLSSNGLSDSFQFFDEPEAERFENERGFLFSPRTEDEQLNQEKANELPGYSPQVASADV